MRKKRLTGNTLLPALSFLLLLSPLCVSCSQDTTTAGEGTALRPLTFSVSDGDSWRTRGVARNVLSGAFGVFASEYDDWDDGQAPNMIFNDGVFGSQGDFKTSMAYVPTANKTMSFFAYFPYSADVTKSTNALTMQTGAEDPGFPYFQYKVPQDVSKQNDLMVAMAHGTFGTNASGEIVKLATGTAQGIELKFHHLLAGVTFKINNDFEKGKVTRLALTNLNYRGDFGYGQMDGGEYVWDWTEKGNERRTCYANLDFTLTGKGVENGTGDTSNELELTDVNETFLVMPQTLNTGVRIQLTYNNGTEDFNLEYPIGLNTKDNPIELKKGAITTFYLYVDAIHRLNVKATVHNWDDGHEFNPGDMDDQDVIGMEAVIKDWDDLDSEGNSTTTNVQTGAQD